LALSLQPNRSSVSRLTPSLPDQILSAALRLQPHIRETLVERSDALADSPSSTVWLKCENLQHTGSFKLRGALNKILTLPPEALARGVVAASTGNHGRGVAHALAGLGARGTIFLPSTAPPAKLDALRRYPSVTLEIRGGESAETEAYAREVAARTGRAYISPYNDLDVVAGQGTIAVELWQQCPNLDTVFVAVGGGGLISGIAAYLKSKNLNLRVVGCWPEHSPALYAAIQAGRVVETPELPTLSDATAGGIEPGAVTLDLARELIDDYVLVSEAEIAEAIRLILAEHHVAIEGAAGVAVAAYRNTAAQYAGRTVAIVLCGGNIAYSTLTSVICASNPHDPPA
jgi:threonine dehydratase